MAKLFEFLVENLFDQESNLINLSQHLLAFAAKHRDKDTPFYHEAKKGSYREKYWDTMRQDIEQLESNNP